MNSKAKKAEIIIESKKFKELWPSLELGLKNLGVVGSEIIDNRGESWEMQEMLRESYDAAVHNLVEKATSLGGEYVVIRGEKINTGIATCTVQVFGEVYKRDSTQQQMSI